MTTQPEGFWIATTPVDSPGPALFAQHNMNYGLVQKGTTAYLLGVLTKHGVTGYEDVLGIFRRVNSAGTIQNLPTIIVGQSANRPAAVVANNNAWYYATDTAELSVIHEGARVVIGSAGFDIHDDVATEMTSPDDTHRLVASNESKPGDPNEWLSLDRLRIWLQGVLQLSASKITSDDLDYNRMPANVPRILVTTANTRPADAGCW